MKTKSLISALVLLMTLSANAQIVALDSFETGGTNYVDGANLVGQGPPASGFTGDWLSNGSSSQIVSSTGLTYPGLVNSGGSIIANEDEPNRNGRLLSTPYTDASSGTVYISFLMQIEDAAGPTSYRAFELHDGGFSDGGNREFQLGVHTGDFGTAGIGFRADNDGAFNAELAEVRNTDVNLYVLKFDLSTAASSDTATVWMNPTLGGAGDPTGGVSVTGFDLSFDRLTLARFGGTGVTWDELRVGDTFAEVTPVTDDAELTRITKISYDPNGGVAPAEGMGSVTITWTSALDRSYSIYSSRDLNDWEFNIDDGVVGEAGETSLTFNHPAPGERRIFFRVEPPRK